MVREVGSSRKGDMTGVRSESSNPGEDGRKVREA